MEFIAATAFLLAVVWGAALLRRGGLLAASATVLVAAIVFGPAFLSLPGGPMPITIDRVLMLGLVVMYGVYRWLHWAPGRHLTAADIVLLVLIATLTANVFLRDYKINKSQPLAYLTFFWMMPLAFYWVARHIEFTERGLKYLFGAMALLGVYLAFTAVCEAKYKWGLVFPRYIVSPAFKEWLGRGRGPLLNPAGNGILMSMSLACGLTFWPHLRNPGKLLLAFVFIPVMLLGIYYTLTRSAWMGGAAALLVMMAAYLPRQWRMPSVAMVLAGALLYTAANWEHLLAFKRDKELTAADTADSASLRPILAYVATQMFLDRPLFGWGLGHYLNECPPYLADRSVDLPLAKVRPYVQHNAVLSVLVETGLLGGMLYLLLFYLWVKEAWRLWKQENTPLWQRQAGLVFLAIFSAYFANAMFQDTTVIPVIHQMLFFFAAAVLSIRQTPNVIVHERPFRDELTANVEREWFGTPTILEHV